MKRLPIVFLTLLMVACSTIDCPVQNVVAINYNIYNSDGTTLKLTDALTVSSQRKDGRDTLFNLGSNISAFSLPVSYSHPEDILLFTFSTAYGDSIYGIDTVWVKKDDIPHFESVDCSAAFFHRITGVRHTHNCIDSLVISNTSVDYDQTTEHFRLYPKTRD